MSYKTVAFDGLSLAGKSTMVQMLLERSQDAEVIRENAHDPYRVVTSEVNKLLKQHVPAEAVRLALQEFPDASDLLYEAIGYSILFPKAQKQALLAYMFTKGRKVVDDYVRSVKEKHDIILDRWQLTGWAYQVGSEGYSWQDIRELNEDNSITVPDVQFLLTCPVDEIPARKAYREKSGVGTAGQMSRGREDVILPAFLEIYKALDGTMPIYLLENAGIPVSDVKEQIRQAIPTFQKVEAAVSKRGFKLRTNQVADEVFWLDPKRLQRIYDRQSK